MLSTPNKLSISIGSVSVTGLDTQFVELLASCCQTCELKQQRHNSGCSRFKQHDDCLFMLYRQFTTISYTKIVHCTPCTLKYATKCHRKKSTVRKQQQYVHSILMRVIQLQIYLHKSIFPYA